MRAAGRVRRVCRGEHSQESITVYALGEMQMDGAQLESVWQVRKTGGAEDAEVVTEVGVLKQQTVWTLVSCSEALTLGFNHTRDIVFTGTSP